MKIIAGHLGSALATRIAHISAHTLGKMRATVFADGEMCPQLLDLTPGQPVALLQSTPPPADHLLSLLLMIDAALQAGASKVIAIIPYLGYARQDQIYQKGQPKSAQLVARLLTAAGAHACLTCHAPMPCVADYFDIPVQNLVPTSLFIPYLAQRALPNPLFVAPDAGALPFVQTYAQHFGAPMVALRKYRSSPNQLTYLPLAQDVAGMDAILVDDLLDTGQTLCQAAAQLHAKGVHSVRALCTHALFSATAYTDLCRAGFAEIVRTDTLPQKTWPAPFTVLSVAPLLASALDQMAQA